MVMIVSAARRALFRTPHVARAAPMREAQK
jgi:hypothetical protein